MKIVDSHFAGNVRADGLKDCAEFLAQARFYESRGTLEDLQADVHALRAFVVAIAEKHPDVIAQMAHDLGYRVEE